MNDFYMKKAAVPRQSKSGTLRDRITSWRDLRLKKVIESCLDSNDEYRVQFSSFHQEIVENMNAVLLSKDEFMYDAALQWVDVYKVHFEKSDLKGAEKDTFGLCGAELTKILDVYRGENNEPT